MADRVKARSHRPDNENENENDKNARSRLVELLHAEYAPLIRPIEGVHFYRYRFRSRYRGLCDLAFNL